MVGDGQRGVGQVSQGLGDIAAHRRDVQPGARVGGHSGPEKPGGAGGKERNDHIHGVMQQGQSLGDKNLWFLYIYNRLIRMKFKIFQFGQYVGSRIYTS